MDIKPETKQISIGQLVILPPYIKPEHGEILGRAYAQLEDYNLMLIDRFKEEFPAAVSIGCKESMAKIQRAFLGDPMRTEMIKSISTLKMCYEQPRFMVKD